VRGFAEKTKANVLFFSVRQRVKGAFYEDGFLWFGKEKIIPVESLAIGGLHNVQNALAVITVAKLMGIKSKDIAAALSEFKGIKHRVEFVDEVDGVAFIDDSKGTNVDATLKAIEAMKTETVLLLGGKNKGYDYKRLFASFEKNKIAHAVLYGENRYALLASAMQNQFSAVTVCEDFAFAVQVAALRAKSGQTVLLSPASASFDEFANYEERGDKFVEIVRALKAEKQRTDSRNEVLNSGEERSFAASELEHCIKANEETE
jgi:UDP-N-acetylmuramoylalanine--D-glutamate ligase